MDEKEKATALLESRLAQRLSNCNREGNKISFTFFDNIKGDIEYTITVNNSTVTDITVEIEEFSMTKNIHTEHLYDIVEEIYKLLN